ncbi:uncharacterized protein LOC131258175 [Magnolia sinica]|uniref:uncharacterized protein LOC131258175 n=1 Tax=Magnolia sinica TaxID=86752 RepID=UPI00265AF7E5|nr:uncharacterized protein LOC131258175 [Magnolia sinica]
MSREIWASGSGMACCWADFSYLKKVFLQHRCRDGLMVMQRCRDGLRCQTRSVEPGGWWRLHNIFFMLGYSQHLLCLCVLLNGSSLTLPFSISTQKACSSSLQDCRLSISSSELTSMLFNCSICLCFSRLASASTTTAIVLQFSSSTRIALLLSTCFKRRSSLHLSEELSLSRTSCILFQN